MSARTEWPGATTIRARRNSGHRGQYEPETGVLTISAHGAGEDVLHLAPGLGQVEVEAVVAAYPFRCCSDTRAY
jgi:hypothetical protein